MVIDREWLKTNTSDPPYLKRSYGLLGGRNDDLTGFLVERSSILLCPEGARNGESGFDRLGVVEARVAVRLVVLGQHLLKEARGQTRPLAHATYKYIHT